MKKILNFIKVLMIFLNKQNERIILMTTKASYLILNLNLKKMILFYLDEKVLEFQKKYIKLLNNRLKIPMENNKRSLNLASSVAIILAECLKQTKWI